MEILFFLAFSAALHAGVAYTFSDQSGGGQGSGGQSAASLQASPAVVSTLVESWRTAPDAGGPGSSLQQPILDFQPVVPGSDPAPRVSVLTAPAVPAPEVAPGAPQASGPAPARIDALTSGVAASGGIALPPDRPDAVPAMAFAPPPAGSDRPIMSQPLPSAPPTVDVLPAEPPQEPDLAERSFRPQPRPERPAPPPVPQPIADPAPNREAAGDGSGATAGSAATPSPAPGLSASERQSLMAQWGAQILRRIERGRPRVRGAGQVVLHLTITRGGQLASIGVARSSGHPEIDQAGIQAVRRAGRFPAAPDRLADPTYSFTLPIRFQ